MARTASSLLAWILITALVVGVSGCAAPEPPPANPGSAAEPADDQSEGSDESSDDEGGRNPQTVEDCLATRWLLNNETWRAMMQPETAAAGGNVDSVTGDFLVDLRSDGSFEITYTEWTMTTSTEDGIAVVDRNGVDVGQWTISGTIVELDLVSRGSALEGYVETDRGTFPMPPLDINGRGGLEDFEFECGRDDLIATIETGTVFFTLAP